MIATQPIFMKLALTGQISVMNFRTENPAKVSVADRRTRFSHKLFFISLISPNIEQDMCSVTLRCVRVTNVAVEKQ
jgi:hypothetical protein